MTFLSRLSALLHRGPGRQPVVTSAPPSTVAAGDVLIPLATSKRADSDSEYANGIAVLDNVLARPLHGLSAGSGVRSFGSGVTLPTARALSLAKLAETISDYRRGEIATVDAAHIDRWLCQFAAVDQPIILKEIEQILRKTYVSRQAMHQFLWNLAGSEKLFGPHPRDGVLQTRFLDIQRCGQSQHEMLRTFDDILHERYKFGLEDCGTDPKRYLYLDDSLFTGNRALNDLLEWLPTARCGTKLVVVFYAVHTQGCAFFAGRLRRALAAQSVSLDIRRLVVYKSDRFSSAGLDCLWPVYHSGDVLVDDYVARMRARFRANGWKDQAYRPTSSVADDTIYSSPAARDVLERAFLRAGCQIVGSCKCPNAEMRPLGFERLESLGFGALFVTYRNISNNCPLALWWGDPSMGISHPLGRWYPLFRRKQNAPSLNTSQWRQEQA